MVPSHYICDYCCSFLSWGLILKRRNYEDKALSFDDIPFSYGKSGNKLSIGKESFTGN